MIGVSVDGDGPPKDPWGIMNSDGTSPWAATAGQSIDSVRRQVVDAAGELMRATAGTASSGAVQGSDSSGQSAMTLYLALLTDRLPVYARTMINLQEQVGEGTVERNLLPVAQATIQFYCEILAAKVSVFTKPDQLLQLRRVLKSNNLGPHSAHVRVAAYLDRERELGRVAADVDCDASARLLIGACVNYAFTKMLLDDVEPSEVFVEQVVRGLRIAP
jgi:AefR-like transcriptional repressor, C-terminal domain